MAIEVRRVTQQPDGLSRRGSADRAPVTNGVADNYRNQVVLSITSQYANFVYIVQVTSVSFYRTSLGKQRLEKPRWRRGRKQHKQEDLDFFREAFHERARARERRIRLSAHALGRLLLLSQ